MVVLLIAGFLLWPSYAVAQSMKRVNVALKGAFTMERISYIKQPGGWRKWIRMAVKGDWMRTEVTLGTGMRSVIIHRGNQLFTNYAKLNHASVAPATTGLPEVFAGDLSPLDFATQTLKGITGADQVSTQDHDPINGRDVYELYFEGQSNTGSLIVDSETNLPVESTFCQYNQRTGWWTEFREEYSFNQPLDDELFSLKADKPTVDVWKSRQELQSQWAAKNLGEVGGTRIHEATVTNDGTVWLVISHDASAVPTWLQCDNAERYINASPFALPGMQIDGRPAIVIRFVPIAPLASMPSKASVVFSKREFTTSGSKAEEGQQIPGSVSLSLELAAGAVPEFANRIGQDRSVLHSDMDAWQVRGPFLEEHGKLLEAAEAYEGYAKARSEWVKYSAYTTLLDAARCYRVLGDNAKADALTRRSQALYAAMER
jgi:hypothetical protein